MVRTRFAPSPTGFLHVGGVRTALFNWLYARRHDGVFVLRIEDTDANRNINAGLEAITDGLRWLGLDWDEGPEAGGDYGPCFQSKRREIYDRHLEKLRVSDAVYEDDGAVRFRSPRKPVTVNDRICGSVTFERDEPDMTIRRPDGSYIFHFVNVVDDIEMAITHVIRGEDHLANTAKHLELFDALNAEPPVYAHIPLILNEHRKKLSKRDAGSSVLEYQQQGFLPEAVVNYLSLLGWSPKDEREILTRDEVMSLFTFENINRSNAIFDLGKCQWFNAQYLSRLSPEEFATACSPFLEKAGLPVSDPKMARILGLMPKKVQILSEIPGKIAFFFEKSCTYDPAGMEKLRDQAGAKERLTALAESLTKVGNWTEDAISGRVKETATKLGVKPGALMFPLRIAASGLTGGPDLFPMLEILGREKVLERLALTAEKLG